MHLWTPLFALCASLIVRTAANPIDTRTEQTSTSLVSIPTTAIESRPIAVTALSIVTKESRTSARTRQHLIDLTCKSCGPDHADIHSAFTALVSSTACSASVSLDGVSVAALTSSARSQSITVRGIDSVDRYELDLSLVCTESPAAVDFKVKSINDRTLDGSFGFRIGFVNSQSISSPIITKQQAALSPPTHSCINSISDRLSRAKQSIVQKIEATLHAMIKRSESLLGDKRAAQYAEQIQALLELPKNLNVCASAKSENITTSASIKDVTPTSSSNVALEDRNPLLVAVEFLIGASGLAGLFAYIKRRCCSLRRRVERLADLEERTKAREYRRAARREAWRRRWQGLRRACLCCGAADKEVDEEKQALIVEGAAPGVSGEGIQPAMAQLAGLYYVQDVVERVARQRGHDQDIIFAHIQPTRSRTSSDLPSYNSDILPDYSSQPESDGGRVLRVANGFAPSRRTTSPFTSSASAASRFTPDSSIPSLSPRHSSETLRTDPSRPGFSL